MSDTLLVTGASGQFGRLVIKHLLETQGVAPGSIIAASRDTSKLADIAAKGVKTVAADFDDAASLEKAFAGVNRLLIVSTDSLDGTDRRLRQHSAAVAAAKAAGVGHIIYTSMPLPDESLVTFAPDHLGTEKAIKASGLGYTILRNSWYMENLFASIPNALKSGQWFTAAGQGKTAYVTREDLARTAAAVLASSDTSSNTYTLTGVEALSNDEIAALASQIIGKPIQVVHVPDEGLLQGMIAAGVPEFVAPTYLSFDTNTRAGKLATVTGDIEKLTGKAPITLKAFFEATKDAFLAA
ncbi:NAD(P)H dehydrogenase (quinone) [Rhizobium aquaticum]|uniref:NAD(P)H dehydrogenase (Quinone) n=1 Tax=Rhizobium aquaticum TaxID=1549636 RepID=A0ABV2IYK1_9HYPH